MHLLAASTFLQQPIQLLQHVFPQFPFQSGTWFNFALRPMHKIPKCIKLK